MVGHESRCLPQKGERLKQGCAKTGMILNGDVGFGFERIGTFCKVGRKHQEPDIVKQGGEFYIVQFALGQAGCFSDQQ